ncbi:type II toxin-antitoxin system VapC family toxin [Microseira sp. BLCC-F43]|jgi:PIN domain nuclease of toxin-antitoxin system|uniref:type II toxin-antitoxin system VapC family toxin n=1 Tax=Microseira sp. BLCC-F43 TaxID=3153602 RepID=UPI0035B889DB
MKYLIDTHILIWFIEGDEKLSEEARALIANPANDIYVSQASLWEMTIKISIGKLSLSISLSDLELFLVSNQFQILETQFRHYEILHYLPFHHQDPFERMIIAQAKAEDYTIITHDDRFKLYDVKLF